MQYQEDISIDCEFSWVVDRNLSRTETRAVRDLENLYSIIIDYYLKKLENRYNRGYILPKKIYSSRICRIESFLNFSSNNYNHDF